MNVVITGANKGIGLAMATLYSESGHHVFAVCRQASPELEAIGVTVIDGIDVADDAAVRKLAEVLSTTTIDILINNAGVLSNQPLELLDFNDIQQQINVNALGPLRTSLALKPCLNQGSKVIMITSRMGSIEDNTSGGYYGYRMSKTALNMAATSLAKDLASDGISVGIIHPGFVKTSMVGYGGDISATEAAQRIIGLTDKLNIENSGSFWHSNGETLPW